MKWPTDEELFPNLAAGGDELRREFLSLRDQKQREFVHGIKDVSRRYGREDEPYLQEVADRYSSWLDDFVIKNPGRVDSYPCTPSRLFAKGTPEADMIQVGADDAVCFFKSANQCVNTIEGEFEKAPGQWKDSAFSRRWRPIIHGVLPLRVEAGGPAGWVQALVQLILLGIAGALIWTYRTADIGDVALSAVIILFWLFILASIVWLIANIVMLSGSLKLWQRHRKNRKKALKLRQKGRVDLTAAYGMLRFYELWIAAMPEDPLRTETSARKWTEEYEAAKRTVERLRKHLEKYVEMYNK